MFRKTYSGNTSIFHVLFKNSLFESEKKYFKYGSTGPKHVEMPHWKFLFCYFTWSWKVLFASEQSQRNKVSGVWLWLWWNQSLTVLNIWGREGLSSEVSISSPWCILEFTKAFLWAKPHFVWSASRASFGSSSWALNGGCQSIPPCSDSAAARLPVPYSSQQLQLLLPSVPTQLWQALTENIRNLVVCPNTHTRGDLWVQNSQKKFTGRPSFDKTIFPKAGGEETIL